VGSWLAGGTLLLCGACWVLPHVSVAAPPPVYADVRVAVPSPADVVWITSSGERYHRQGCKSLARSRFKTTRGEAEKAGKRSCGTCKP
jgi:hypothetical protein